MADKTFQLELVTPERHMLTQTVEEVTCPGLHGSFGVLAGHVPMVMALRPGQLKIKAEGQETLYVLGGGFAEIMPGKTLILADTAERAEDIDIEAARKERERAVAQMKKGVRGKDLDQAEISLHKALARLRVADTMRRRKPHTRG
ncbi:MAG: F0F1 ATP synthase subunit epsilon [candidate division FCPU426 bacterium]